MIEYDENALKANEDRFGPVSEPFENYMRMPDTVKLNWIGKEEDLDKLDQLLSEPYVGIDSEWKMTLYNDKEVCLPLI